MILMIDNYDSFTYNLVHYLECLDEEVRVFRNDEITLDEIKKIDPEIIVLSPGPCTPNEAGISKDIVKHLYKTYPILGICLGHQTIAQIFGAHIIKANEPVHGKVHLITHHQQGVFCDLKNPLKVTRYHSLVVDPNTLPSCLEITAQTFKGEIMGIKHKRYLIEGVQFHPEAILTECGIDLLKNFIQKARSYHSSIEYTSTM